MICPTCHGTGSQYIGRLGDFPAFSTACPTCQGSGWSNNHYLHYPCQDSEGAGIVSCCDTAGENYKIEMDQETAHQLMRHVWSDGASPAPKGFEAKPFPATAAFGQSYLKPEDYWADVNEALADER